MIDVTYNCGRLSCDTVVCVAFVLLINFSFLSFFVVFSLYK